MEWLVRANLQYLVLLLRLLLKKDTLVLVSSSREEKLTGGA